jgi:hypothetical protein
MARRGTHGRLEDCLGTILVFNLITVLQIDLTVVVVVVILIFYHNPTLIIGAGGAEW